MQSEFEKTVETSIKYNGRKYTRKENGYYYNCSTRKHLHQAIWIDHNGPIPKGCEIHHKDLNKENNDISNLECLTKAEHKKLHGDMLTEEQRQWRRENLEKNARPKANEWHRSEAGKIWHSEHAKKQRQNNCFKRELICTQCGKKYIGELHSKDGNTFCSNACKSKYARQHDLYKIEKVCVICGKLFKTNKYRPAKVCSKSCANKLWRGGN